MAKHKQSKLPRKKNIKNKDEIKQSKSPQCKKRKSKPKSVRKKSEEEDCEIEIVRGNGGTVQVSAVGDDVPSSDEDSTGDDLTERRNTRKLVAQQNRKKKKSGGFQSMGLSHNVFKGVIRKGYKVPTPIQRKTVPMIIDGKDVVAMARTGSGKTAAFLIPMFELLQTHSAKTGARALILSPTRELAMQTLKFTKDLGKFTGLRAAVILGGDRMEDQFAALHESPDIIIATPGRFMHVAMEMDLKLKSVQYVVFDEADRLFEMGFQEQLHEILYRLPESRQTLLFSATLPKLLVEFAKAGLHDPTLVRLDVDSKLSEQLKMSFFSCRADDKMAILLHLLQNVIPTSQQTVVFAATKHHVEYIHMILQRVGISSTYMYSSLDQTARKINVAKFQHKKSMVMVVTDLAARGIDIPMLDNVINFHFPAKPKLFVHRVGRVARAGRSGTAYSLIAADELASLIDLHLFLGRALQLVPLDNAVQDEDGLYGRVPQSVVDDIDETLKMWIEESLDLKSMCNVCRNAYKQYIKSRPAPAPESVKRVKEMDKSGIQMGMHPIFGSQEGDADVERQKLLNSLQSYKANTTIFEINSTSKTNALSVMKQKRAFHGDVIDRKLQKWEEKHQKAGEDVGKSSRATQQGADEADLQNTFSKIVGPSRSGLGNEHRQIRKQKSQKIKDEENYLPYRPADYQAEQGLRLGSSFDTDAANAVLDITGDDNQNTRKLKHQVTWDRKRKKFVKDFGNDPKKKKIKTESGAWISASYKSNAYKDWMEKNKVDVGREEGEQDADDDANSETNTVATKAEKSGHGDRFTVLGFKKRKWHTKGTDSQGKAGKKMKFRPGKRELKQPEQILKARKIKERKQAFQRHRQAQHTKRKSIAKQKERKHRT